MSLFQELGLREDLVQAVTALGFDTPTPVQQAVIPYALTSVSDIVALAQTGTGKTAAFGLPILQLVDASLEKIQALVLCPTRELCVQVASDLENFAQYSEKIKVVAVYGGARIETQITQIKRGAQIVVATPGRLIDLLNRGVVKLDALSFVVLDEADEMLNMGFRDDLNTILGEATQKKSTWLFSATMSNEIRSIARKYMDEPIELMQGQRNQSNENIEHTYYVSRMPDRYETLKRIVDATPNIFGLIFCRTKAETKEIADQMMKDGYNSNALHGDMTQAERDRVMAQFRDRSLQLLIATDVAARGIDVNDITHVIHYGLPEDIESYTHRSGRTGRAGKKGVSIAILTSKFEDRIPQIERKSRIKMKKLPIPTGDEVCANKLMEIIQNIKDTEVKENEIERFLPQIEESFADLTKEDLIKRLTSVEFNRFLDYYKGSRDLNPGMSKPGERGDRSRSGSSSKYQRIFANVGVMDGLSRRDFAQMLVEIGIPSRAIGDIDMKKAYSHFELSPEFYETAQRGLANIKIKGRSIRIDPSEGTQKSSRPAPSYGASSGGGGSFGFDPKKKKKDKHRKGAYR